MPCLPIPIPPIPTIPSPFSLDPPELPQREINVKACCNLINIGEAIPPIPLPPLTINPASIAIVRQFQKAMQQVIDEYPVKCPRQ